MLSNNSGKITVLVLYGGRSAEHPISLISARFIVDSLDRGRFEPLLVAIDPRGCWHLQSEEQLPRSKDPREVKMAADTPLAHIAPMPSQREDGRAELRVDDGRRLPFDVAFPVLHGPMGEDGTIQGLLELANVAYVGAGVSGSAVGMDKVLQKQILEQAELPVVAYRSLLACEWQAQPQDVLERCEEIAYPLFVKPANMGSSLGISKATDRASLREAIRTALQLDRKVIVERGLEGIREIELAVLGNDDPRVSLPGEITVDHADGFYSYDAKYIDADGATLRAPADLYQAETRAVQLLALRAFRVLDGAGMARVDLFLTPERDIYVNEINTIPGFTAISMYPQLWQASGVPAAELVSTLLDLALGRAAELQARRGLAVTHEQIDISV